MRATSLSLSTGIIRSGDVRLVCDLLLIETFETRVLISGRIATKWLETSGSSFFVGV